MLKIKGKINYFFILFWILLVASINNPLAYYNANNIVDILRFIISLSPIFVLIISAILYIINFNKFKSKNLIFLFFIGYSLIQIISYFLAPDLNFDINIFRIYWPICILSVTLFMIVANNLNNNQNIFNILLLILLFYLGIYSLPVIILSFIEIFNNKDLLTFYSAFSMSPNNNFFGIPLPRSSGIGRNLIFFYILLSFLLIFHQNKNYFYLLKKLLLIFISFYIFHLENRSAIYFLLLFNIFIFFYFLKNKNFKDRMRILFIMLVIPYFIHVFAIASKKTYQIYSQNKEDNVFLDSYRNTLQNLSDNSRIYVLSNGSGRIALWKKSIKPITDNFLIGYGPQADRILITENISNIFLYSLLCGGILAFIFILLIIINILNIILYLAFVKKYFFNKKNIIVNSSIFFIIFLLFRSLFETSFAIFGFDFMIFIICCTILYNYTKISFYSCLKNNLNLFFK
jgi:hypothetical protein